MQQAANAVIVTSGLPETSDNAESVAGEDYDEL